MCGAAAVGHGSPEAKVTARWRLLRRALRIGAAPCPCVLYRPCTSRLSSTSDSSYVAHTLPALYLQLALLQSAGRTRRGGLRCKSEFWSGMWVQPVARWPRSHPSVCPSCPPPPLDAARRRCGTGPSPPEPHDTRKGRYCRNNSAERTGSRVRHSIEKEMKPRVCVCYLAFRSTSPPLCRRPRELKWRTFSGETFSRPSGGQLPLLPFLRPHYLPSMIPMTQRA